MNENIKWGLALKIMRESSGLSASELSQRAGLSSYIVSRIETGKLILDFSTAVALTKELGVSLDLLALTANTLSPDLLEQEIKLNQARKEMKELRSKTKKILKTTINTKK